eukprot:scaffold107250_cov57-Phaeocystis_antarctica.AAC.1
MQLERKQGLAMVALCLIGHFQCGIDQSKHQHVDLRLLVHRAHDRALGRGDAARHVPKACIVVQRQDWVMGVAPRIVQGPHRISLVVGARVIAALADQSAHGARNAVRVCPAPRPVARRRFRVPLRIRRVHKPSALVGRVARVRVASEGSLVQVRAVHSVGVLVGVQSVHLHVVVARRERVLVIRIRVNRPRYRADHRGQRHGDEPGDHGLLTARRRCPN